MNRVLTLLQIALLQPRTATERRLRAVVVAVTVCAFVLGGLLFVSKSQLNAANVNHKIDTAVSEFRRVSEPVIRRLLSIRGLVLNEGVDITDSVGLSKIRSVAVEPIEQVNAVIWADDTGFEEMHIRTGAPEQPWRVLKSSELPFKSAFSTWFTAAVVALDEHGDEQPRIMWSPVGKPFPDDQAEFIGSLAWRVEIEGSTRTQVAAFVINRGAVQTLLDSLDLSAGGAVLTFPVGGKTVMTLSSAPEPDSDIVRFRDRATMITRTEAEFGRAAADLLAEPTPDKNLKLVIRGRRSTCACRQVDLVGQRLWVILALPLRDVALLTRNEPILITLLVTMLVVGLATIVHMALRTSESLERLTSRQRYSESPAPIIHSLIQAGESESVEFKSTLRWNLKADRPGKEISQAVLKSIGAFCNSDGGTLLVGVEDNGNILGIEADRFSNEDKYLLHFNNMLKEHLQMAQAAALSFDLRDVGGHILVIDCPRLNEPMFVRNGDEQEYYVRLGPGTRKLTGEAMMEYIAQREKC